MSKRKTVQEIEPGRKLKARSVESIMVPSCQEQKYLEDANARAVRGKPRLVAPQDYQWIDRDPSRGELSLEHSPHCSHVKSFGC